MGGDRDSNLNVSINMSNGMVSICQPGCSECIWAVVGFHVMLRIIYQLSYHRETVFFPVYGTWNPVCLSRPVVSRKHCCANQECF